MAKVVVKKRALPTPSTIRRKRLTKKNAQADGSRFTNLYNIGWIANNLFWIESSYPSEM